MALPGFPSHIVLWNWEITPGIEESKTFTFLDADGDDYDPGVVTAKAKDGTIAATVTGDGNTRAVTWSIEQTEQIPATHWRLNFDGQDQLGGRIGIAQPEADADLTDEWTIQLPAAGEGLTVTVNGVTLAQSVLTRAWTGRLTGLDQNVAAVLDMIDAGLDDHYVALFVADDDYSGGTLTTVTMYDTGSQIPRSNVAGAPVCVVSGDDMGLWTVTASGPCTPGRPIDPGDLIRAFGQGFIAVAGSNDGETVAGINVAATYETVRGMGVTVADHTSSLSDIGDELATQGTAIDALGNTSETLTLVADASSVGLDLLTTHLITAPPAAWMTGGEIGPTGHWYCETVIPSGTETLEIESWFRLRMTSVMAVFFELYSECRDSGGVAEQGGIADRFEQAIWATYNAAEAKRRLWAFWEYMETGGTVEEWLSGTTANPEAILDPAYACAGAEIPGNTWCRLKTYVDFATGTSKLLVPSTTLPDWVSDRDDSTWRTIATYVTDSGTTSLIGSNAAEQWIARGGGQGDIARVQRWDDGVQTLDADPSVALDGATSFEDSVLLDENDDPAIWTARYNAAVVKP